MKYTLKELKAAYSYSNPYRFMFFNGHHPAQDGRMSSSCFSQMKAKLFGDMTRLNLIMTATHPSQHKAHGRKVVGFNDEIWKQSRYKIVLEGNLAKFSQKPDLRKFLLSTCGSILVEASPYDRIWGIGLSAHDVLAKDIYAWKGENLLGFTLMEVRDILAKNVTILN